eukprot:COSAG01_NODE_5226_length_4401_cov_5.008601_8_plen_94_part_00
MCASASQRATEVGVCVCVCVCMCVCFLCVFCLFRGGGAAHQPSAIAGTPLPPPPLAIRSTCAHPRFRSGEDNRIDHSQNWLRFPYDSTCSRSN